MTCETVKSSCSVRWKRRYWLPRTTLTLFGKYWNCENKLRKFERPLYENEESINIHKLSIECYRRLVWVEHNCQLFSNFFMKRPVANLCNELLFPSTTVSYFHVLRSIEQRSSINRTVFPIISFLTQKDEVSNQLFPSRLRAFQTFAALSFTPPHELGPERDRPWSTSWTLHTLSKAQTNPASLRSPLLFCLF